MLVSKAFHNNPMKTGQWDFLENGLDCLIVYALGKLMVETWSIVVEQEYVVM